jgi:hypothetical protein
MNLLFLIPFLILGFACGGVLLTLVLFSLIIGLAYGGLLGALLVAFAWYIGVVLWGAAPEIVSGWKREAAGYAAQTAAVIKWLRR